LIDRAAWLEQRRSDLRGGPEPFLSRFLAKVQPHGDCWIWTASLTRGYGTIQINGKYKYAHRLAFEWAGGAIPHGLQIDHLCRNRACVNPGHLEPVTSRENTLRGSGIPAENKRKTHCVNGHEFTPENTVSYVAGIRQCRECFRIRSRRRYYAQKEAR
jgi:hypothetical protein